MLTRVELISLPVADLINLALKVVDASRFTMHRPDGRTTTLPVQVHPAGQIAEAVQARAGEIDAAIGLTRREDLLKRVQEAAQGG